MSATRPASLKPAYIFLGEDTFRLEEALARMKHDLANGEDLNVASYQTEEIGGIEAVLELCNTLPFLSGKRLVILRNFAKLKARGLDRLATYLNDPCEFSTLILTAEGQKSLGKTVTSRIPKAVEVRHFEPFKGAQVIPWIQERVQRSGKHIARDAASLLADILGANTWFLASEIEKLCLFIGKETTISLQDVRQLVVRSSEANLFAFTDALFNRRKDALFRLQELETGGTEVLLIIGMLENQALQHYRVLCEAADAGIHPYVLKKISTRRKFWNANQLMSLLDALRDLEHRIKTGRSLQPFVILADITATVITSR